MKFSQFTSYNYESQNPVLASFLDRLGVVCTFKNPSYEQDNYHQFLSELVIDHFLLLVADDGSVVKESGSVF